jgi:hypothetical protein
MAAAWRKDLLGTDDDFIGRLVLGLTGTSEGKAGKPDIRRESIDQKIPAKWMLEIRRLASEQRAERDEARQT